MASKRPVIIAVTSDQHCGSTLGLCPLEGVRVDDDSEYHPSKAQQWTWACWGDYWKTVGRIRAEAVADLYSVYNGDAVEGDHHQTSQIISRNPEPQTYITERVFGVPRDPTKVFVVRGTETHVGPGASSEEHLGKRLKAERSEAKTWSHWRLRMEVHGVRLDFLHHGRTGTRPWTRASAVGALAAEIFYEHTAAGYPHPHLAIRSHRHVHADSYDASPTRVIQTPAWQLKTAHAHKVAPESIADIGGIIVTITPDGQYDVEKKLYKPELPKMWAA